MSALPFPPGRAGGATPLRERARRAVDEAIAEREAHLAGLVTLRDRVRRLADGKLTVGEFLAGA